MKNNFTIFYSWQSDISRNRNVIKSCIEKAIKEIQKNEPKEIELEINIDRDTVNKSGSPAIADTIFKKIKSCDIFICDTTIINKNWFSQLLRYRLTPNPNVLIELGYAINVVGWDRILCLNDNKYSTIEELPFDIRGHRICSFASSNANFKNTLTHQLKISILHIIKNYEKIINEQQKSTNIIHDLNIYKQIVAICSESNLIDSLFISANYLFIDKFHMESWDKLQTFYKLSINQFLDNELDELMKNFLKELNSYDDTITRNFNLEEKVKTEPKYLHFKAMIQYGKILTEDEEYEFKKMQRYSPEKEPYENENIEDLNKRIIELGDDLYVQSEKVKLSYRQFVLKVKQLLM